jgi:hypothetical protein
MYVFDLRLLEAQAEQSFAFGAICGRSLRHISFVAKCQASKKRKISTIGVDQFDSKSSACIGAKAKLLLAVVFKDGEAKGKCAGSDIPIVAK